MQEFQDSHNANLEDVDVKELLFKLLSYWRLYLVLGVLGVAVAWIVNRYATDIYKLSTTVNIKESENPLSSSSLNLMFKWGGSSELIESHKAILLSRKHNLKIIERLNLEVEYFSAGRVKLVRSYDKCPFRVEYDKSHNQISGTPFEIALLPSGKFALSHEKATNLKVLNFSTHESQSIPFYSLNGEYNFDTWIEGNGNRFRISLDTSEVNFDKDITWYFQFSPPTALVDNYIRNVSIEETSKGGSLLSISMTGDSKSKIVDYLNTSIDVLKEYELEEKNQLAENTIKFVDLQLGGVVDSLRAVEKELEDYRVENQVIDLTSESAQLYARYMELEKEKAELFLEQKYYAYLAEYLQEGDDFSTLLSPTVVGIEDPLLQQFVNRLVQLSVERNQMQFSMEQENPVLEKNSREIILTQKNLKESVDNLIRASKIKENDIRKRTDEMQGKLAELPNTEQQLINIRRKYELSSTQYDFLIQKRAEAELIMAGNLPDVQVIDPAADYGDKPIKPRRMFNLALGLFFGLLGPTLYVLIRIFFSNKLETKNDLEKTSSIPIIGTIGHSSGSSNIVIQNGLKSAVAESFRIIRTNLNFVFSQNSESNSKSKVVLVTSSVGGEGKTFCSINLSSIISISGAKTIIVGLDMRKPKIFNDFRLTNDTGLSEYLSNQVEIDQIIKATTIDNLDFITAGPVPPNPGELLMSPRLGTLIEELKSRYEYVILDTPPITLVSDALELMKFADATLYVVRQNYTTRDLLGVINEQNTKRGIKNISLIFNDVIRKGYGYDYGYNYGYNYGYGYYDEDDQKVPWWKRIF